MLYLFQVRLEKYFDGGKSFFYFLLIFSLEYFNDEKFCDCFLKLYDMLLTQEQIIQVPVLFSSGVKDLVKCVEEIKFT